MIPVVGGGIGAAEAPKTPGLPDVKAPRLSIRKKPSKKEEPPKKVEKPKVAKARKKRDMPRFIVILLGILSAIAERLKGFYEFSKHLLKEVLRIARTREFGVVASVFLAYVLGFVLFQQYSNVFLYLLPGIVVSAVIYKVLSDQKKERRKIREEKDRLKLLEDRSRVLLDNALDCVFTLDLQGSITSFNRKAERVTGYLKKDVVGQSFGMFLPQEGIKDFFNKLQKAISTGSVPLYELDVTTIYGRRNFEMNLTAIKSREKVIGIQGISRDITDRKRLEKELKMATSDLERWSKRTVKKEMTILDMKNQIKTIKRELEAYGAGNN